MGESILRDRETPYQSARFFRASYRKGSRLIFLHRDFLDITAVTQTKAKTPAVEFGRNDLQPVAQALQAQIGVGLNWLAERGLQGRMTGSGSAIFAPLPLGGGAQLGTSKPADGWTARVCSTLQVHPLADW